MRILNHGLNSLNIRALAFLLGTLIVSFAWIYTDYLIPVGKLNDKEIYRFEIQAQMDAAHDSAVKSYAKDKMFFTAMNELGISVSKEAVQAGVSDYAQRYGGIEELKKILLDNGQNIELLEVSVKKSLLSQAALNYFKDRIQLDEDDITAFYEDNSLDYPQGLEAQKRLIENNYKAQKGQAEYNEYMEEIEKRSIIKIY